MNIPAIFKRNPKKALEAQKESKDYNTLFTNWGWQVVGGTRAFKKFRSDDCYKGATFKAVDFISKAVERLDWDIINSKTEKSEEGKYTKRLLRPSVFLTWEDLVYCIVFHLEFDGNSFWYLDDSSKQDGLPKIQVVPFKLVTKWVNNQNQWLGFKIWINGANTEVPFENIIHFKYPDPRDPQGFGFSTLEAMYGYFTDEDSIGEYKKAIYENKGVLGGVISGGNQKQNQQVVDAFQSKFGGLSKAAQWAGAPEGFEVQPLGLNPQELDLSNISNMTKADIYQSFGVPQLLVGMTEKVNRANMQEAKAAFQFFTVFPIADRIQRTISAFYLPEGLEFNFKLELPPDMEMKLREEELDLKYGIRARSEIRRLRGEEPYAGSEQILLQGVFMDYGSVDKAKALEKPDNTKKEVNAPNIKVYNPIKFGEQSWKAFVIWEEELEKGMIKGLNKNWNWIGNKVASNLSKLKSRKAYDEDMLYSMALLDLTVMVNEFEKNNRFLKQAIIEAVDQKTRELGFELQDNIINQYIEEHLRNLEETWKGIAGTDLKQLKKIIHDGLGNDKTLAEIAKTIDSKYNPNSSDFMNRWRANTISRTEIGRVANSTSHEYIGMAGVPSRTWITAGDEKVRSYADSPYSHLEANGQEQPMKSPFIVGGEQLMYPGDPNGSAGNVINCRCIEVPSEVVY